jgi:isochorismate hydrolase
MGEENGKRWMKLLSPYLSQHRAENVRFARSESALIVIDMQRYFLEPSSHAFIPMATGIKGNVGSLVEKYHRLELPVVFTKHALLRSESPGMMASWWGDTLYDDDEMSGISPALRVERGDAVVRKTRYDAFTGTDLEGVLRRRGVRSVLITGVMTHLCCETTAREAFVRDFKVFFVVDGTATQTEDLHVASLKTLTDGFAIPVTTRGVLEWLEG